MTSLEILFFFGGYECDAQNSARFAAHGHKTRAAMLADPPSSSIVRDFNISV